MTADFTTSNKDSLRGEAKKRGGEDSSLPNQSLLISLPSPLLSTPPPGGYKQGILCVSEYGVKQILSEAFETNEENSWLRGNFK